MRILLTNDDGVHADGLASLERIAARLSDDVWVVAPELEQSGASRAMTLTDPVRVRRLGPRKFAVSGTPTDCVILALTDLIEGAKPDLVLSGVNRGANLGEDISMSGTVAAALEAMVLGCAPSRSPGAYSDETPNPGRAPRPPRPTRGDHPAAVAGGLARQGGDQPELPRRPARAVTRSRSPPGLPRHHSLRRKTH